MRFRLTEAERRQNAADCYKWWTLRAGNVPGLDAYYLKLGPTTLAVFWADDQLPTVLEGHFLNRTMFSFQIGKAKAEGAVQ